jgi:uncharacterized protein (DUF58 family)
MAAAAVIVAILALVWLQGLLYRKRWNSRLSLRITFSAAFATEGDTLNLTEVITNRKLLPLPWLAVKFQVSRNLVFTDRDNAKVSDDYYRNDLFNLLMFQRLTRRLPFVCGRRGFYTVKSAELVSGDILAKEKLTMSVPMYANLTVYPRVLAGFDAWDAVHKQFLGQVLTKRFIQPDPFEFKGIREYQPYDSLRSVNFKATAKTGDLMVNVRDYTISQEIVLVLNLQPYNAYPSESLQEDTIRLAATLAAYYIGQAVPVSFVTNASGGIVKSAAAGEPAEPCGVDSMQIIESGSGAGHLTYINDTLAHIDLRKPAGLSGGGMLNELIRLREARQRAGLEPAYVILSTFQGRDFTEAHKALTETGADVLWLIPTTADMETAVTQTDRVRRAVL